MGLHLIASDIPPHRELTPGAELIDPLDGLGWLDAIERASTAAASAPPAYAAPAYTAPDWTAHFAIVADAVGLGAASPLASAAKAL